MEEVVEMDCSACDEPSPVISSSHELVDSTCCGDVDALSEACEGRRKLGTILP